MTTTTTTTTTPFYGPLSGNTWVSRYQRKHSPSHTFADHQLTFICFLHLLRSVASSLFNLHAWQSFCTTSFQVLSWSGTLQFILHTFLHPIIVFATHAHTVTTCFAVVPRLCHLILVFLIPLPGTLSFTLMPLIHPFLCYKCPLYLSPLAPKNLQLLSLYHVSWMPHQLLYPPMPLLIHLLYLSVSQHSRYQRKINPHLFCSLSALRSSWTQPSALAFCWVPLPPVCVGMLGHLWGDSTYKCF